MKALPLLIVATLAFAFAATAQAFMLPEDKIGKQFWETLDAKTKPIFLMGFRHGTGAQPGAPETKRGFLVLSLEHFTKVIERVDAFYAIKDNEHVPLRLAIEICLMQMTGKPQSDINALTKQARELIYTAY